MTEPADLICERDIVGKRLQTITWNTLDRGLSAIYLSPPSKRLVSPKGSSGYFPDNFHRLIDLYRFLYLQIYAPIPGKLPTCLARFI